jgi:4-diphosphocytidyl-2-C-methyl-D-erythritol kinase
MAAVPDAVGRLKHAGASYAAMSGSGAALFGLFQTPAEAESAAKMFAQPGWRTFVSQTIDRASYHQSIRLWMDTDS